MGDSLQSSFSSTYNVKVLSTGFLIINFFPLSLLIDQKKNQPWNLVQSERRLGKKKKSLTLKFVRVFEKALLLPVYIEAFFCMHREAVSKQTICQVGLSAQRPAAPRACTGISWHYGHCHISLPNARPDAASCLRACSVFRQVLTRETPSERHSVSPAPLSSPNDTNRNSNRMASPGGRFTSLQKSHRLLC